MGPSKAPKTSTSRQRSIPRERLLQKMSEVISLREKVAQAELAARFDARLDQSSEVIRSEK